MREVWPGGLRTVQAERSGGLRSSVIRRRASADRKVSEAARICVCLCYNNSMRRHVFHPEESGAPAGRKAGPEASETLTTERFAPKRRGPSVSAGFSVLFLITALCLFLAARYVPGFPDHYRAVMNPVLVSLEGGFFGLLPCSAAELLIYSAIPLLIFFALRRILLRALCFLFSLGVLLFMLNEGVYFSCTRFAETYGFERGDYTTEELAEVCRSLAEALNERAPAVTRDADGIMMTDRGIGQRMVQAVEALGGQYPELRRHLPHPKPVLCSAALSYGNLTGIYSIFTVEANYNREMPPYNIPFTMAHELSHLCGITSEKESNFIGYLACIDSQDPDIRYSGAMLGWVYCGNELYRRDYDTWYSIASTLDDSVNRDLEYNTVFWNRHKGKTSETVEKVNDTYLKAGGIEEGVKSYDLVVDLIVTYEMSR